MTKKTLADLAIASTRRASPYVSPHVREHMAFAYIARWIENQDESISPALILAQAHAAFTTLRRSDWNDA